MAHLEYLFLQALKQVETLPDFSRAVNLRRIYLQTMKGIRDLRPIATAPAIEELILIDMGPPEAGGPATPRRHTSSHGRHDGARQLPEEHCRNSWACRRSAGP